MGHARYLVSSFAKAVHQTSREQAMEYAFRMGFDYCMTIAEVLTKTAPEKQETVKTALARAILRHDWKLYRVGPRPKPVPDQMERVPERLYVGLLQVQGATRPEYRDVKVPRYFVERLQKSNRERLEADEAYATLVEEILEIQNKVYRSRTFPPKLRNLIFQRDGYRCQNCGKHKTDLAEIGGRLEVDHILAVIDGGLTTYKNGETLCNECNIAKHNNKTYYALLGRLRKSAQLVA